MISLYKEIKETKRIKRMDNEIFFFADGGLNPFAYRCADTGELPQTKIGGNLLFDIGAFSVYEKAGNLCCIYHGTLKLIAHISSLDDKQLNKQTAEKLEKYFLNVYKLDPYTIPAMTAFEKYERLVSYTADFCGCLTDIIRDNDKVHNTPCYSPCLKNVNCEHIALALPIISLMYRRIAALRGFNFKVTVKESLPCLIFSAKVLFQEEGTAPEVSAIPEYSELANILRGEGIIIGAKLRETDEFTECGERVYRLSVAVCPPTFNPRSILCSPDWYRHNESVIDRLDLELDGKY